MSEFQDPHKVFLLEFYHCPSAPFHWDRYGPMSTCPSGIFLSLFWAIWYQIPDPLFLVSVVRCLSLGDEHFSLLGDLWLSSVHMGTLEFLVSFLLLLTHFETPYNKPPSLIVVVTYHQRPVPWFKITAENFLFTLSAKCVAFPFHPMKSVPFTEPL